MKERAHSFRNDSGSQSRRGDARKRPGPLLGILRFRPRRVKPILVALALAITIAGFAGVLTTPDRPTVATADSGGHSSPVVSWTEPDHPGPDIADYGADYELRYRIGGSSGEFTDAEYAGDQTSATITGLVANTTHVAPGGGNNNPIGGTARVAAQAPKVELWSATLTVGKHSSQNRLGYNSQFTYGSLSRANFTHRGNRYNFPDIEYRISIWKPIISGPLPGYSLQECFDADRRRREFLRQRSHYSDSQWYRDLV